MPTLQQRPSSTFLPIPQLSIQTEPLIVVVLNLKGGVAKTTTAVHFAYCLAQSGETLLVDGDPNRSAIAWSGRAESLPFRVISEAQLPKYAGKKCRYVIDTKARPESEDLRDLIDISSLIILPTPPSGDDLRVTAETARVLKELGSTQHCALLTKVPVQSGSTEVLDAKKFLSEEGVPVFKTYIRHYKAYQYAFLQGAPVCQVKNPKAQDAWSDYLKAAQEVFNG